MPGAATAANGLSRPVICSCRKPASRVPPQPCRLTVTLHGCLQSAEVLDTEFYTKVGVNEWADTNRIIVLYPQAPRDHGFGTAGANFPVLLNTNPQGCWNWWGYAVDTR